MRVHGVMVTLVGICLERLNQLQLKKKTSNPPIRFLKELPMTTVADVCRYLELFAPTALAEDWDNVGLLLGDRQNSVTKIMTCLTMTADVANEA
ncbi:MAG: Nif3-like dinuclear metal center hexameric protein, partial [Planctomycetota bacterium]|nr:Nif3-like dinuclear metal center hexameric protein [Planctomycetota bacterium]